MKNTYTNEPSRSAALAGALNRPGIEILRYGLVIALRYVTPLVSGIASLLSVGMFLTTLSFLFTTPGWEPSLGGFPGISAMPGQFLLKDIVLVGAAVLTASEAFGAVPGPETRIEQTESATSATR